MEERVLVLFSGGRDSLLATCYLVEEGYHCVLVHYNNGCSYGSEYAEKSSKRLITRYGEEKVSFWGIGDTSGYFYDLRNKYATLSFKELLEKYPNLSLNQANCLACRTAMYVYSILICQKEGITKIAEGARISQKFAIEQIPMLNEYRSLLNSYGIELLTPVLNLVDDEEREIELMIRNINPKVLEPKCLLGSPMNGPLDERELAGALKFYRDDCRGYARTLIQKSAKIPLDSSGKIY